jgi:hypothetical protein
VGNAEGEQEKRRVGFSAKQNAPDSIKSPEASVDQPSPKCCSRTTLIPSPNPVNGSPVPCMARTWWVNQAGRKYFKNKDRSGRGDFAGIR